MVAVLMWRLVETRRGQPVRGNLAAGVTVGATELLGDGDDPDYRVWFRCLHGAPAAYGDGFGRNSVVCEVREPERARERTETATGLYRAKGWVLVDGPRELDVVDPPVEPEDIWFRQPLLDWAISVEALFRTERL